MMKKLIFGLTFIILTCSINFTKATYTTTSSNEYFICDGAGCWWTEYSLGGVDKSIMNDITNYKSNYINSLSNILRETTLYKTMKKSYITTKEYSPTRIGLDDPILWDERFDLNTQTSKITINQVAKKLGITNFASISHIKNINLINMYYSSLSYNRDFQYARSLTTGTIKSLQRYEKTYKNLRVYINTANHRKEKNAFIYKGKNTYYFPVVTCSSSEGYDNCEVYGVTKQIINGKIKQISSKYLGKYQEEEGMGEKPVIYFYPTTTTDITAKLDLKGQFSITYPQIDKNNTRSVSAQPDGTLTDKKDGKEYSYIFREAKKLKPRKIDQGFVVKKKDYITFLQEKLAYLGLTPREYNEFIVYRVPLMNQYPYVALKFAGEDYTSQAPLTISPQPDSMQRVFMIFKGLDKKIDLPTQKLEPFVRSGFSVIERGGTEIYN